MVGGQENDFFPTTAISRTTPELNLFSIPHQAGVRSWCSEARGRLVRVLLGDDADSRLPRDIRDPRGGFQRPQ